MADDWREPAMHGYVRREDRRRPYGIRPPDDAFRHGSLVVVREPDSEGTRVSVGLILFPTATFAAPGTDDLPSQVAAADEDVIDLRKCHTALRDPELEWGEMFRSSRQLGSWDLLAWVVTTGGPMAAGGVIGGVADRFYQRVRDRLRDKATGAARPDVDRSYCRTMAEWFVEVEFGLWQDVDGSGDRYELPCAWERRTSDGQGWQFGFGPARGCKSYGGWTFFVEVVQRDHPHAMVAEVSAAAPSEPPAWRSGSSTA